MKGLAVGQKAHTTRTFTKVDVSRYRDLTGDSCLEVGAVPTPGNRETVPGPLLGGLFSYLLGTRLPGYGTNWLKQNLSFPQPAYLDEEIIAEVEIVRLRPEKALVNLNTLCKNQAGEVVCEGKALVRVADLLEDS